MNWKKWAIASVVVFVVYEILSFVIHSIILSSQYQATASAWRADMNEKIWITWVVALLWSFLFLYIFIKGYEAKGWLEGLRYGFWIGLFVNIPMSLNSYAVYPIPFNLAVWWFVLGMVQFMACGIVAAAIYSEKLADEQMQG